MEVRYALANSTTSLELGPLQIPNGIGIQGAIEIAKALPNMKSLTSLHLDSTYMGTAGVIELAKALKSSTSLTSLKLTCNDFSYEGAIALAEALPNMKSLTSLNLFNNYIGDKGAIALAEALKSVTSLTFLNLGRNNIRDAGVIALTQALQSAASMTFLDLTHNNIGSLDSKNNDVEGVIEIAKAATSLTSLCLYDCCVGAAGRAAILRIAKANPSFITEIVGLRNSDEINDVVATNRENLAKQAQQGALILERNYRFPLEIARIVAGYVRKNVDIKNVSMAATRAEEVAPLAPLAPAVAGKESSSIDDAKHRGSDNSQDDSLCSIP